MPTDPGNSSPPLAYAIPGRGTSYGCTISGGVPISDGGFQDGDTIYVIWSTMHDGDWFPSGTGRPFLSTTVDANGLYQILIDQATAPSETDPSTQYYAGISTVDGTGATTPWVGDPIAFKTFPPTDTIEDSVTIKWALGSCQYWWESMHAPLASDMTPLQKAWIDMRDNFGPDILWEIGDFHYRGALPTHFGDGNPENWLAWADMYWQQLQNLDEMRKARAKVIEDQVSDDHEYSQNNGDSFWDHLMVGTGYPTGLHRYWQMVASQKVFAMYDLAPQSPMDGMFGTYMLTPNVRVIILDAVSFARTTGITNDINMNDKTFLGDQQYDWLKQTLRDIKCLNIIVCGKAYLGDPIPPSGTITSEDLDKIWNYGKWRQKFSDFVTGYNDDESHAGAPINIVWLGGDRHMVAYQKGGDTGNPYGGFPCYIGSGWSQDTLSIRAGELYSVNYPFGNFPVSLAPDQSKVMGYARGTITDDPVAEQVTFAGELMYLQPTSGQPKYNWPMEVYNPDSVNMMDVFPYPT